ncbi:MAG: hypothetical protein K0S58_227 [Nitrospira sp.]|nr:hypothetical protein [Nitrospira sp.]
MIGKGERDVKHELTFLTHRLKCRRFNNFLDFSSDRHRSDTWLMPLS